MSNYGIEKRSTEPKNFFAGEFPIVTETGTAGADIKEYAPVMVDTETKKIIPVAKTKEASAIGIAASQASTDEPVTYYLTGEYFADALAIEDGADLAAIKEAFRKESIYLR